MGDEAEPCGSCGGVFAHLPNCVYLRTRSRQRQALEEMADLGRRTKSQTEKVTGKLVWIDGYIRGPYINPNMLLSSKLDITLDMDQLLDKKIYDFFITATQRHNEERPVELTMEDDNLVIRISYGQ